MIWWWKEWQDKMATKEFSKKKECGGEEEHVIRRKE